MPLLKSEPAGTLKSLEELFALAHAMESEAARRYAAFAVLMREHGRPDLADVFERIAAEEQGHVDSVSAWSRSQSGSPPNPSAQRWPGMPTFEEDDAAEIAGSRLMTPYRALGIAVRNEERAFAFWSYVAAQASVPEVKHAAERMAQEELGHVAAFRRERRKAFHAAREHGQSATQALDAADVEHRLASLLDEAAREGGPDSERLGRLAREAEALAVQAHGIAVAAPSGMPTPEALAEALADAYLQASEHAGQEDELERLQPLAGAAIRRLAALRGRGGTDRTP